LQKNIFAEFDVIPQWIIDEYTNKNSVIKIPTEKEVQILGSTNNVLNLHKIKNRIHTK
jgi:hypothetical protein